MMNKQFSDLLSLFLLEIKKKFGITAKVITNELGVSKNILTNWKKGIYKPNEELLRRLLFYLESFKKERDELIIKDSDFYNLLEELISILSTEFDIMLKKPNVSDRKWEKELQRDRKEKFQKTSTISLNFCQK